ncbi:DUF4430 domain-containing protein [Lactococcus nasutitermitis]|uniref:DUF4430 domain-containing protein n=1 Tax=Lactococcus nasutitermitis TaxID=1652957 RepID=A0ABV9JDP9_9LACT|nr:DUF4430 domain-containing protein [Lactococcus nasutitermitis]
MKKVFSVATVALALLGLAACQKSGTTSKPSTSTTVRLTVQYSNKKSTTFENVKIKKNETVMTLLKSKEKVEATNGFITKIGKTEQNPVKKQYWMYKINGKLATKGASQEKLKNKDKIVFYLGD